MILLDNARIYRFDANTGRFVRHRNLLIERGRIVALDVTSPLDAARVDLDGAVVLPAFADCHVHVAATGYATDERNLAHVRSYEEFDRGIAGVPRDDGTVFASKYDDARWHDGRSADASPLERHHGHVRAMAVRVDGHSCIVNRTTLAWLNLPNETPGIERDHDGTPSGRLFADANWTAQSRFIAAFSTATMRRAERRAVALAQRRGIVHLHAQLLGRTREGYSDDVAFLKTLPAKIHPKICEPDATLAHDLGLRTVGGDVFLDGSIGSCTAALSAPYERTHANGTLRFTDEQLYDYFATAERLNIAAGVHAIGDAAIDQCIRTWQDVLGNRPSPHGTRHFIEHFELATDEHIAACARMNIHLSMQPQFDASWGEPGGMYDERLGTHRSRHMNALNTITRSAITLCGGSDSPVCDLDALAGMHAACNHHNQSQRIDPHTALAMYTVNAARLAYTESQTGNCEPNLAADLVVLDKDPLSDSPSATFSDANVLQTWIDGSLAYDASNRYEH